MLTLGSGVQLSSTRGYHQVEARWLTPDPSGLAAVNTMDPQSWNQYAYVLNNPVSAVDPLGLYCQWEDGTNDSSDDPDTGTQGQCEDSYNQGTWIDDNGTYTEAFLGNNTGLPVIYSQGTAQMDTDDPSSSDSGGGYFLGGTVIGSISSQDPFHCAAAMAQGTSLASKARLQGDNPMSQMGQHLLGNTFSGIVDFYDTAKNATNAAPVYLSLFLDGGRLGLPGGGTLSQGAVGKAQDWVLKQAFQNVGKQLAKQAVSAVGDAKVGYDALTFLNALYQCTF